MCRSNHASHGCRCSLTARCNAPGSITSRCAAQSSVPRRRGGMRYLRCTNRCAAHRTRKPTPCVPLATGVAVVANPGFNGPEAACSLRLGNGFVRARDLRYVPRCARGPVESAAHRGLAAEPAASSAGDRRTPAYRPAQLSGHVPVAPRETVGASWRRSRRERACAVGY